MHHMNVFSGRLEAIPAVLARAIEQHHVGRGGGIVPDRLRPLPRETLSKTEWHERYPPERFAMWWWHQCGALVEGVGSMTLLFLGWQDGHAETWPWKQPQHQGSCSPFIVDAVVAPVPSLTCTLQILANAAAFWFDAPLTLAWCSHHEVRLSLAHCPRAVRCDTTEQLVASAVLVSALAIIQTPLFH
jgi:hypothetical protein